MFSDNDKISLRQLQALLILDIFGTSVIALPRKTAELAGRNGWILIIGAGILVAFYSFVLNKLSMEYPTETFVELSQKIASKPIGILLCVGLMVKLLLSTGLELRIFCEILRQTMLLRTPLGVLSISMLLLCAYIAWIGYECRGRAAEILVVLMFIPLIFVFATACYHSDFTNLLPVFTITGWDFLRGSLLTALSFQGLEFLLLVHPFVRKREKVGGAVFKAVIIIGILMVAATVITVARFGEKEVQIKLWPVLQMMDTIDIPGAFIERQDAIIMKFWIISTFAGVNAGIFLTSLLSHRLLKRKWERKNYIPAIILILFFISIFPDNVAHTYELLDWLNRYLGALYFFVVPLVLLLVSRIRKKVAPLENQGGEAS